MKRKTTRLCLCFMLLVLCLPGIVPAAPERRTALVIGNGSYDVGPLKNPVNDAADMASTLKRLGFDVILKENARMQDMENAIREFGRRLKRGGEGLFFYAGHGVQIGGKNYLIPIGAKIDRETDAKYQAIDAEMVLDEMANAGNNVNIMILDACRDNPLWRSLRSAGRGLAVISDAPQGTFITYSTSPGKTAADGAGRNSPYTAALLRHMNEPGLPVEQVFKRVRQTLTKTTDGRQIPWELSSLQGDFFFSPGNGEKIRTTTPRQTAKLDVPEPQPAVEYTPGRNLLENPGFENKLEGWGTGQYEPRSEVFWGAADATATIDTQTTHSGKRSLKIVNRSSRKPQIYRTMSQRINGLKRNTQYLATFWVKADNTSAATLMLTIDMAWSQRIAISAGTYNWREFKRIFDTGNKDYADFRFISEDVGTVWLDDISFREM
jgi:hypothetical protein